MPRTKETKNKKPVKAVVEVKEESVKKVRAAKKTTEVKESEVKVKEDSTKEKLPPYYYAVGRRKTGSARVRLYIAQDAEIEINGKKYSRGQVIVNDLPATEYFAPATNEGLYLEPFRTTNTLGRFVTTVKVEGSGKNSQMEAMILGISRAIETIDPEKFRPILKKKKFLTRDSRARERRKAGIMGARTRKQSPKR